MSMHRRIMRWPDYSAVYTTGKPTSLQLSPGDSTMQNGRIGCTRAILAHVLGIYDSIDHPLWDGSGVYVFYDLNGTEVTSVSWLG